jgi:tripartite-type tricarboxylate transporter receptor subunit TctC
MTIDHTRRRVVTLLCSLPFVPAHAAAVFPARTVRIVVPYGVGVGPDLVARSVAEYLKTLWGQTVLVENKPGASGIVAFGEVRSTPADGYTLFLADTATMAVNPLIHATLPYDPQNDLAPLTLLFRATFVLLTGGAGRYNTATELLDAARRAPGRISYATLGNGHASHVAVESMARAADVRMLHVPFKDPGTLLTAVANGDVDLTTFSMNSVSGFVAQGRLRALAVAARVRLKDYPQVPTLAEAGGPAVEMHPWAALVARAGTPPPLLEQLHRDITAALGAAEVRARADTAGFELTPSTPQQLRERIAQDLALYRPLVAEGRISNA